MKLGDLGQASSDLLALFVAKLTPLVEFLPESRYVSAGQIAWDGESVTVYVAEIAEEPPGGTFTPPTGAMSVTLYVQILREVVGLSNNGPLVGMIPNADQLNTSGMMSLNDAGALVIAAFQIHQDYSATSPGESFEIGPLQPIGPEGGFAAMRLALKLAMS